MESVEESVACESGRLSKYSTGKSRGCVEEGAGGSWERVALWKRRNGSTSHGFWKKSHLHNLCVGEGTVEFCEDICSHHFALENII